MNFFSALTVWCIKLLGHWGNLKQEPSSRSKIRKLPNRKIAYQATSDLKSGRNLKCLWKMPIALD